MLGPNTELYCIGGGNPSDSRMVDHYSQIVDLARASIPIDRPPKVALLPTAHRNGAHPKLQALDFIDAEFSKAGCVIKQILLGDLRVGQFETSNDEVKGILNDSDALFVLGGDTRYMLDILRERNLVPVFEEALTSGLLFSGSSAGTIWLSEDAMSDSESFAKPEGWDFIMLKGLGLLPFVMNVHDDQGISTGVATQVARKEQFESMFLGFEDSLGLAVDEFVGLEIRGGVCTVRSPSVDKGAYLLGMIDGTLMRRKISGQIDLNDKDYILRYVKGGQ